MASTEIAEQERFVVLDGLRGLAALAVITDHVNSEFFMGALPGRYLAVDFFFVLSGFVLAHVYAERLRTRMSLLAFLRVRIIRLYPLYLVGLLLAAALAAIHIAHGWRDASFTQWTGALVFGLFLLPSPPALSLWHNSPYSLNGPSWSLFFELFVNVIFAAVARWLTPALCLVFMAVGGLLLVPTAFHFGQLDGGFAWDNFIAGFPRVTFGFFTGVWIYQMRARRPWPTVPAWAAFLLLLAVFAVPAQGVWRAAYDLGAALLLFPAIVAVSADARANGALLRLSASLGLVSYGVYILHVPLWEWLRLTMDVVNVELPGAANVVLVAVVAITVAAVLTKVYDEPVRRFLSRKRTRA